MRPTTVRKGNSAPPFELPHKPGETVNLSDHIGSGPVVLLFFPLAFSSTCTDEMCAMRDTWADWQKLNATVFGISVDSPFVTDKFRQEHSIPFPILSDFNKDVSRQYGVLYEEYKGLRGVSKRSAFVINNDGEVVYDWVSDDPGKMPPLDDIRKAVEGAK